MHKPLRILICDDDEQIRAVVKQILCGAPDSIFQCSSVSTFRDCLEVCEAKQADYVILDLELPDRLGFEGLREMHDQFPHIPVIIFTGHHNQNDALRAVEQYGVLAYITKPIDDINQFYKAITDAIVRHNNETRVESKISKADLKLWAGVGTAILTLLTALAVFGEKLIDLIKSLFN